MRRPRDPRSFLPLTHLAFHLLLVLTDEPVHGYPLLQRIRERSHGLVNPGAGSFYSIIQKLADQGLISEVDEDPGQGTRRVFSITPLGRAVLTAEADRLASLAAETRRRLRRPLPHGGDR